VRATTCCCRPNVSRFINRIEYVTAGRLLIMVTARLFSGDSRRIRMNVAMRMDVDSIYIVLCACSSVVNDRRLARHTHASFYQRVSIASYANRWYSQRRNVRLSVCPSVTLRYCIKTKKASVIIYSPPESLNILVSRNIWFITKFDRGHLE